MARNPAAALELGVFNRMGSVFLETTGADTAQRRQHDEFSSP